MSEQLRSLRHERDVREHGDAVTTRPWWNAPGEESREPVQIDWASGEPVAFTLLQPANYTYTQTIRFRT